MKHLLIFYSNALSIYLVCCVLAFPIKHLRVSHSTPVNPCTPWLCLLLYGISSSPEWQPSLISRAELQGSEGGATEDSVGRLSSSAPPHSPAGPVEGPATAQGYEPVGSGFSNQSDQKFWTMGGVYSASILLLFFGDTLALPHALFPFFAFTVLFILNPKNHFKGITNGFLRMRNRKWVTVTGRLKCTGNNGL